ncbi:MAG: ferric reductase-like transmembrane domain-containing protein [Nocardioides sp.]|nr:ferric reductase-like transmembrane domain-containing protein [Nocardioides sp.]
MTDGPLLWYLNRGSGLVVLALLTLSTVLGVLSLGGLSPGGLRGRGLPRFVTQSLHRNIALVSVVALVVHVATAVADTYVDIRWWQALVPWWGSTYEPLWLGLGTLALDLIGVIVVTSLLRTRLTHRLWRRVHLLSWAAWGVGLAHGIGIGTDLRDLTDWAVLPTAVCAGAVLAALGWRLVLAARGSAHAEPDRRVEVRA